jgi:hypothetical protein
VALLMLALTGEARTLAEGGVALAASAAKLRAFDGGSGGLRDATLEVA